jgi:hypothetical protein
MPLKDPFQLNAVAILGSQKVRTNEQQKEVS